MFKLIILCVLFLIITINSKSINNQLNNIDKQINNKNSEIARNSTTPPKSDKISMFKKLKSINKNYRYNTKNNNNATITNEEHFLNVNEGRGKNKKIKKKMKMLMPLMLIILAAKSIFLPFLLKGLTIISASSFILSKISLVLSLLILLRLLNNQSSEPKVEIHSVPIKYNRQGWRDRQATGGYGDDINVWDDLSYTNTNDSSAFPYNHFQI